MGRARSWVWRLVSVCWLVSGWVVDGLKREVWGEMVPWSLGLAEDVRRGMRVEREGRRRSVVQNMVDWVYRYKGGFVLQGRPLVIEFAMEG